MTELGNCGWHFQTLIQNNLLPLQANILRPLDETREIAGGLNILPYKSQVVYQTPIVNARLIKRGQDVRQLTNTIVAWMGLKERVFRHLAALHTGSCRGASGSLRSLRLRLLKKRMGSLRRGVHKVESEAKGRNKFLNPCSCMTQPGRRLGALFAHCVRVENSGRPRYRRHHLPYRARLCHKAVGLARNSCASSWQEAIQHIR